MRRIHGIAAAASLMITGACNQGGTSTEDVKEAAVERARETLRLPADAPLEATVWTGQPFDGQLTVCGTVSSARPQQVRPQRFIATIDPLRWQVFEDAHSPMIPSQPGKFPDWSSVCGTGAAAASETTEDERCGTRIDANQDGMIQQAEYNSFGFAFDNWDVDDDYRVSPAEFQRCWGVISSGNSRAAFRTFDEDGDGFLSQEEFFSREEFPRWDTDGDGSIPKAEFP